MITYDVLFSEQCCNCRGVDKPCPVAFLVSISDDEPKIIDALFKDGKCKMLQLFQKELTLTEDEKNQLRMFE